MNDERRGRRPGIRGALSRRDLVLGGTAAAGLAAGAASLGAGARRAFGQEAPVELVFSFAPDESGSMQSLIEAFNREYQGRINVSWREMPTDTDAYRRQLESDFQVGTSDIDVIGADVIWTAQFAYNDWIRSLSDRFYDAYSPDQFLDASMDSTSFRNRIWAVPWFTAAGMMYYRQDLLEQAGFDAPPRTWEELKVQALRVKEEAGVAHGFVFQGGEYEGGVTNCLEYIWSAGGRVLTGNITVAGTFGMAVIDPNVITVNSLDTAQGLDIARSMIADGVAPEEVIDFTEQEALDAFLAGEAVFMRNWPFAFGVIRAAEDAAITPEQVGIAPIPVASEANASWSCLGGWNLMISALSRNPDAAWEFVRFATSPEMQKLRAIEGGFLPTLRALYDDPAVLEAVPVVARAQEVFPNTRARPVTPFYPAISQRIAIAFNRVLRGEISGIEAARRLERELRQIIRTMR